MLPEAEDCAIILTVDSAYGAESMENLPKRDNKVYRNFKYPLQRFLILEFI